MFSPSLVSNYPCDHVRSYIFHSSLLLEVTNASRLLSGTHGTDMKGAHNQHMSLARLPLFPSPFSWTMDLMSGNTAAIWMTRTLRTILGKQQLQGGKPHIKEDGTKTWNKSKSMMTPKSFRTNPGLLNSFI